MKAHQRATGTPRMHGRRATTTCSSGAIGPVMLLKKSTCEFCQNCIKLSVHDLTELHLLSLSHMHSSPWEWSSLTSRCHRAAYSSPWRSTTGTMSWSKRSLQSLSLKIAQAWFGKTTNYMQTVRTICCGMYLSSKSMTLQFAKTIASQK